MAYTKRTQEDWDAIRDAAAAAQQAAIVADLEAVLRGEKSVPAWVKPWDGSGFWPCNAISGRPYNGTNVPFLLAVAEVKGYAENRWLTKQSVCKLARERGGFYDFRGEKTVPVFHWSPRIVEDDDGSKRIIGWNCKVWDVLNVAQVRNLPADIASGKRTEPLSASERDARADAFFGALGANVEHGGSRACYNSATDTIRMPPFVDFRDAASYYSTRGHEHVHWTGHKSRLDRALANGFGSEAYALEELIAELGSAMLCATLQLDGQLQHREYLAHWLRAIRENGQALSIACAKAREAYLWLCDKGGLEATGHKGEGD